MYISISTSISISIQIIITIHQGTDYQMPISDADHYAILVCTAQITIILLG